VNDNTASPNSAGIGPGRHDHAPGLRSLRWNIDWILRPLFGIFMAIIAIAAVVGLPPKYFPWLIVLLWIPAAYEWHRMVAQNRIETVRLCLMTGMTAVSIAAAIFLMLRGAPLVSVIPLAAGAAAAFLLGRDSNSLWQAAGVGYLGLPALALVALRVYPDPAHGARVIVGLFFIVWATDTGALVFGNLIGGPRLAPSLSPGKTWAGTIGGSLSAALVYGCYIGLIGGPMEVAALFAFWFSAVAHGGDLLESFVKRRFGFKDSGSMIPGHGGILDRLDSTFAAAVALAILVFGAHLNPLFWGHL
jgi:phosphatidate cytidylyltransferase